jgi:hypothetical protein
VQQTVFLKICQNQTVQEMVIYELLQTLLGNEKLFQVDIAKDLHFMEVNTELTDTDQTWNERLMRYRSSHGLVPLACSHSEFISKLRILQGAGRTPRTGDAIFLI